MNDAAELSKWRGAIDAKLAQIEVDIMRQIAACNNCRESRDGQIDKLEEKIDRLSERLDRRHGDLYKQIVNIRVKLAAYVATATVIATVLGAVAHVIIQHITGGAP